jgi:parvulin-like peptidyl-prolyl isomerase
MEGLSENKYKENLEDQYRVQALTYQKVTSLIDISPQDVMDYYREHEDEYRDDEKVRVSNLLILLPEDEEKAAEARGLAEKILGELNSGQDFAELARKYSKGPRADQGGDLGYFKKGQMRPKLDQAAFLLEVGDHSGIIETDLGYHIIKCTGKREAYQKPLEELWDEISDKLYKQEYQRRYDEWIKKLKSRAYVAVED